MEFELQLLGATSENFDCTILSKLLVPVFSSKSECVALEDFHQNLVLVLDDLFNRSDYAALTEWLRCVTCILNTVVQANFVGPPTVDDLKIGPLIALDTDIGSSKILNESGEGVHAQFKHSVSLILIRWVLVDQLNNWIEHFPSSDWWTLRYVIVLQSMLAEKDENLHKLAVVSADRFQSSRLFANMPPALRSQFCVERAGMLMTYYERQAAYKEIKSACEYAGFSVDLTGELGKRTRFQQFSVAQLVLKVQNFPVPDMNGEEIHSEVDCTPNGNVDQADDDDGIIRTSHTEKVRDEVRSGTITVSYPRELPLDDDTLLERVQLSSPSDADSYSLVAEQQCVLLALLVWTKQSTSSDDPLLNEELGAYLRKLLDQPKAWAVQTAALLLRCTIESKERRKIERCLAQVEEIIDQFSRPTPGAVLRAAYSFSIIALGCGIALPPIWEQKKILADLLRQLGCVREALEIYESLQYWEETIDCYRALGRLPHAERIIRDRLLEKETPSFLCLLGDVTDNPEYYLKAWALSGQRSSRAQRSLGMLYFCRQRYADAIESLQLSLRLQPLQIAPWFTLGYCAMQIENYELASHAYHRCVNLEPDNFEAWNNLSAACIHLKQKEKAYQLLQEALRYNYEHWKVWENFLLVSVDTGHFTEAIAAIHRLLDLKEDNKWLDVGVLHMLVKGVLSERSTTLPLRSELLKLFGRLTARVTYDPGVWYLYAQLCGAELESLETPLETWEKFLRYMVRVVQCATRPTDWHCNVESARKVLQYCCELVEAQLQCKTRFGDGTAQSCASTRLLVKSVLSRLHTYYGGPTFLPEDLSRIFETVDDLMKQLVDS